MVIVVIEVIGVIIVIEVIRVILVIGVIGGILSLGNNLCDVASLRETSKNQNFNSLYFTRLRSPSANFSMVFCAESGIPGTKSPLRSRLETGKA